MKVLLLGDYSGFYKNLKEGLAELGHETHLATTGDGFKKTAKSDLYIPNSTNTIMRVLQKIIFPFSKISEYFNYDVVQLVNNNIFGAVQYNYNYQLLKSIKENSGKMFMSSCGDDYFVYQTKNKLRYNPWDEAIKIDFKGNNTLINQWYIKNNINVAKLVDGIIPVMYTYAEAYREHANLLRTIPLPIDVKSIKFIPQKIENNKLKIFHGLNREGSKGTKYIAEAMNKLKEKYPNEVEIIIDGKMPLKEYLKLLEETNVVIDQALSYEYGMNALYSMAMGKVVLSGNEPECQQEFDRTDIPIINILPDVDDIYNKLEKLVIDKKSVIEIGRKSREFVEDFHDHLKIAQMYVDTWNNCKTISEAT